MKLMVTSVVIAIGLVASVSSAEAVSCANGVYRAGCVGPNGAAVVGMGL